MITYSKNDLTTKLTTIHDKFLSNLKEQWFSHSHKLIAHDQFVGIANEWFQSTKINNLIGWNTFPCVDITMGCTNFIESFILKYGWDGFQILNDDYSYYNLMGKFGTDIKDLVPGMPLIISLPNWKYGDLRPDWEYALSECEKKNIDIHIDFAWITMSKGIEMDLSHPCIKSFAMSMSKYDLQWNRVGLRWSRQRTMDAITIFNHYYGEDVNSSVTSCGAFMMNNIPRDYGWDTYEKQYYEICKNLNVEPTNAIHVVKDPIDKHTMGVGEILSNLSLT
jgi:hypothetical protein